MFDIKDYYNNYQYKASELGHDITEIDEDVSDSISQLVNNRFDRLYIRDRYKYQNTSVEIIFPGISYIKSSSLILSPDKIRYLLSFYPNKSDLKNIARIVVRPRFVEIGNIELISLYLRKKGILVIYLFHPHFYRVSNSKFNSYAEFIHSDFDKLKTSTLLSSKAQKSSQSEIYIHPLWYMLSLVEQEESSAIDKFFIKRQQMNDAIYEALNDISFFYSQHGY